MQPWKMFVKSVSVVTVLTAGGFFATVLEVAEDEVTVDG